MFRHIGYLLDRDSQLSPITRWRERLQRLDAALQPHLPPEIQRLVRVASQEGQSLSLIARHSAAAARLRQLTPRLVSALREAGIPVLDIQVKVDTTLVAQRPQIERHLSAHALDSLGALQQELPEGPLKEAVGALLNSKKKG